VDYLILGNGPSLSTVDWESVRNSTLKVAGVNRSYFIYDEHDFLFLQDPIVIQEMFDAGMSDKEIRDFRILTTPYFSKRLQRDRAQSKITAREFTRTAGLIAQELVSIIRLSAWSPFSPFTVINLIGFLVHADQRIFKTKGTKAYNKTKPVTFYLAGCDLSHSPDNNHFWQSTHEQHSRLSGSGGSNTRQLTRQYHHFKRVLVRSEFFNFRLVSVTKDAKINKIIEYEPINTVLNKHRKRQ